MNTLTSTKSKIPRTTATQRRNWIQRFRQSDLTRQAFAKRHGVGLSTLGRWLKESQDQPAGPVATIPWQEVAGPVLPGTTRWAAELCLPNGTTLRLTSDAAQAVLAPWLQERAC